VEVEVVTTAVEVGTTPVKVVVEAEPSSGARRRGAQEAHSPWAPSGLESEEPVSVLRSHVAREEVTVAVKVVVEVELLSGARRLNSQEAHSPWA
jgi:hypothetical protein